MNRCNYNIMEQQAAKLLNDTKRCYTVLSPQGPETYLHAHTKGMFLPKSCKNKQ